LTTQSITGTNGSLSLTASGTSGGVTVAGPISISSANNQTELFNVRKVIDSNTGIYTITINAPVNAQSTVSVSGICQESWVGNILEVPGIGSFTIRSRISLSSFTIVSGPDTLPVSTINGISNWRVLVNVFRASPYYASAVLPHFQYWGNGSSYGVGNSSVTTAGVVTASTSSFNPAFVGSYYQHNGASVDTLGKLYTVIQRTSATQLTVTPLPSIALTNNTYKLNVPVFAISPDGDVYKGGPVTSITTWIGPTTFSQALTCSSTLAVNGALTANNSVSVSGANTLTVGGDLTASAKLLYTAPCLERSHSVSVPYTTGADANVLFDTLGTNQGGISSLISYNTSTGVFTNTSGRTYVAIISYQVSWAQSSTGFRIAYIARNSANSRFGQSNVLASGDYTTNSGTAMFPLANNETFWIAMYSNINTSVNTHLTFGINRMQITLL
jgi:hypothetical protein